jgi:hypothetical protein
MSRKRKNNDDNRGQHQESRRRMCKTIRGKCTNMDRSGRGPIYESRGSKVKGSVGKGLEGVREHKHPSIGRTDDDHFGTEVVICGSGTDAGSTEDPSTMLRITARRSIEGDR